VSLGRGEGVRQGEGAWLRLVQLLHVEVARAARLAMARAIGRVYGRGKGWNWSGGQRGSRVVNGLQQFCSDHCSQ
jgi:hypothetical protein